MAYATIMLFVFVSNLTVTGAIVTIGLLYTSNLLPSLFLWWSFLNKTSFENARTFWQRICLQHPEYQALQKIKVFDSAELEPSDTKNLSTFLSPFLPPFEAQNIQLTALANHPLDGATNQRSATNPHKIILFLLAITLIFLSTTYFLQQKKITKTQQQLTQITQKKTASAALVKEKIIPKISKKQIQAVNAAIDALNFPLLTVFKTIEPPKNISVALLSIDLNHQTEQSSTRIKINGEAPDYAAMIQYVSFLSQQDDIQKSILLRHETVQDTKNNRPNDLSYLSIPVAVSCQKPNINRPKVHCNFPS